MKQILLLIIGSMLLVVLFGGGLFGSEELPPLSGEPVVLVDPETTITPGQTLQLRHLITPTPTSGAGGGTGPGGPGAPLPTPVQCRPGRRVAVNLLLDTSNTMRGVRIDRLKEAIRDFANQLNGDNDAVVGMQEIKDPNTLSYSSSGTILGGARVVIQMNTYPNNIRNTISTAVDGLQARGATHLRDGFALAQQEITAARPRFSGYEWIIIFLSDGRPQIDDEFAAVPYPGQDPRPIVNVIRGSLVNRIISIAIAPGTSQDEALMRNVAYPQSAENFHLSRREDNATDLRAIWRTIGNSICR